MRPETEVREGIPTQAAEWFVAHRSDELTDAQRERFIDWLRASPEHVREYLALTGFTADLKQIASNLTTPAETLVSRARADLDAVQPLFPENLRPLAERSADVGTAPTAESRPHKLRAWAVAAGLAMTVFAIGFFSVWKLQERSDYSTAHAEQRSWRMSDGSTVHLNSGSQIKVRFDERRREVELIRGQALFQVAKDAQRPFWVRTGDAVVKAVGTEFDVYRQSRGTLISVMEGRVAVWRVGRDSLPQARRWRAPAVDSPLTDPVAQLDAGQQARIDRGSAQVSKKADDVRKTVAWLQRQVVFDHDPLGVAVEEFNRYSDVRIRIADAALSAAEVSGIFSAYDAEAFIRFLQHQPDMQVERTRQEVVVTSAVPAR